MVRAYLILALVKALLANDLRAIGLQASRRIITAAPGRITASNGLRLRGGQASLSAQSSNNQILVLDVDGTLYGAESGIEQQIIANIHRFATSTHQLTPQESDALHNKYGSTLLGLKTEHKLTQELEERFYREVYGAIDYSGLLGGRGLNGDDSGYKHRGSVREILMRSGARIAIASNSPSWHVKRVLAALGLSDIELCAMLTPDSCGGLTKSDPLFWSTLVEQYQPSREGSGWGGVWAQGGTYQIDLLDDSKGNLDVAELLGIRGTLVMPDKGFPLEHALLKVLGGEL